ncbi:MAG: hypothetical protein U9Q69_01255 [Nanoarchaeota archaeon]|nr:hypothetical protein [Nanoarchaeota archaeon]
MEEKTYKRWFPSARVEMPVETPRELPNSFPIEFSLREKILHTQGNFRMECYGFVNNTKPNYNKKTVYYPLTSDGKIGITHHSNGLGKLKYNDQGREYGVPITDINNKPINNWRIDKK